MAKKCKVCGFEYGEFDIFCSRCGAKINPDEISEEKTENISLHDHINKVAREDSRIAKEELIKNVFDDRNTKNEQKKEKTNIIQRLFSMMGLYYNNSAVNFGIAVFTTCLILTIGVYFLINYQKNQMTIVQYKNYISHPSTIPMLKEPTSVSEMENNFNKVENFLRLYLQYSQDNTEEKMAVFDRYLYEMNKLSHINTQSSVLESISECNNVTTNSKAKKCSQRVNSRLKNVGITSYYDKNVVYLYPNYLFIKNTYNSFLDNNHKNYLNLKVKNNQPSSLEMDLIIPPIKLAKRIASYEKFLHTNNETTTKEMLEEELYNEFRAFIFSPEIYSTTTQEMKHDFKHAYKYFIKKYPNSLLTPVLMSYLDKQRKYDEDNFKIDYPYKTFEKTFDDSIEDLTFKDIFEKLRKNVSNLATDEAYTFIYNISTNTWIAYSDKTEINEDNILLGKINPSNNNVDIFDNTYTKINQLNVGKYSKFFLAGRKLYIYNANKLAIYQVNYNGRIFNITNIEPTDVTTIFPGVNPIIIDSYPDYNINIVKENKNASYIVLSRYMQGFSSYKLTTLEGQTNSSILPNMFSVSSNNNIVISFHSLNLNPQETSDNTPTYKINISTFGNNQEIQDNQQNTNDEQSIQQEQEEETQKVNIMPKILQNKSETVNETTLSAPPSQILAPPKDDD